MAFRSRYTRIWARHAPDLASPGPRRPHHPHAPRVAGSLPSSRPTVSVILFPAPLFAGLPDKSERFERWVTYDAFQSLDCPNGLALAGLQAPQRLGILSPSRYANPMSGEPANFNARAMARWLAIRGRPRAERQPPGPRPTIAELQRSHCWTWVYCEKCLHHAPMALVPLMIRWGAETSSDRLRQCARCTKCGHKGATLQRPGWAGRHIGFQPFPVSIESSSQS
jgi:hypothetical protein